jgi:predicted ATPase/DNA-binding CsgD family transcriptional regulator
MWGSSAELRHGLVNGSGRSARFPLILFPYRGVCSARPLEYRSASDTVPWAGRGSSEECSAATGMRWCDARILVVVRLDGRREQNGPSRSIPSIPAPLTALIGRASELQAVGEMLRRARLVTLTGPAGVGKTRTAIELGRGQVRQRADGVWLVDLASVRRTEDVAAETARVLGIRGAGRDAMPDAVLRYLADRDVLLLLDNCEHVLDASAELGSRLLGACPHLHVLATSREPLGVPGEAMWRLEPLSPQHAYRLFLERAQERRPGLVPDEETEATVLNICARVDHLPLGIELAAARVSIMSPDEIAVSLEGHLGELARPRQRTPAHHRSVRAAVEWSYTLLDPAERASFRSLAVFVGGFDADAARAVAPSMSLDVLARLVDKSLVAVVPAGQHRTRYRLLDTMRAYALEELASANEVDDAQARHLRYFSTIGIPIEYGFMSAGVVTLLEQWAVDYGNVRSALEWAAASEPCVAMRLLAETRDLFFILGQADGSRLAEMVLRQCPERNRHRAWLMISASHLAFQLGNLPDAAGLMTQAAELSVELGERAAEGAAHLFLGLQQILGGAPDKGRGHLTTARAIYQETGDLVGEGRSTAALGLSYFIDDERVRARELLEVALAMDLAAQDRWSQGQANLYLGILAESSADPQAASSYFREAVECQRPYDDSTLLPMALVGEASVMAPHDPATALQVVAAACAVRARNGGEFAPFFRAFATRTHAASAKRVGADADRLWKSGSRLTVDEAIGLAFGTPLMGASASSARRPRVSHVLGISEREIDVVRLVAEGLSNKEIAKSLHVSVRTVETHIRHMLTKTGLVNRTQLATWARERGE